MFVGHQNNFIRFIDKVPGDGFPFPLVRPLNDLLFQHKHNMINPKPEEMKTAQGVLPRAPGEATGTAELPLSL